MKGLLKNEKRFKLIVFLTSVLVLGTMFKCAGQINRYNRYDGRPDIITIAPEKVLEFKYGNDTIFFGTYIDSLDKKRMYNFIYVYYPKSVKKYNTTITIGFKEGLALKFEPISMDSAAFNSNYVEYQIKDHQVPAFHIYDYKYISFDGVKQYLAIEPSGTYFRDFYNELISK